MKKLLLILTCIVALALAVPALADVTNATQGTSAYTSWGGTYAGAQQVGSQTAISIFPTTSFSVGGSAVHISPDYGFFDNDASAFAITGGIGVYNGFLGVYEGQGEAVHGTSAHAWNSSAQTMGVATYQTTNLDLFGGFGGGGVAMTGGYSEANFNGAHSVSFSFSKTLD